MLKPQIEISHFTDLGGNGPEMWPFCVPLIPLRHLSVTHPSPPRLLEFPQAFLDWRRSDGLIPGQPRVEEGYDDGGQWDGEPL